MIPIEMGLGSGNYVRVHAILAMDINGIIGYDDKLIFNNKEDLQFFKEKTLGHPCIMGRKTFEGMGRILPKRQTIIVSSQGANFVQKVLNMPVPKDTPKPLVIQPKNYPSTLGPLMMNLNKGDLLYVCGGAQVYTALAKYTSHWVVTRYRVNLLKDGVKLGLLPPDFKEWKLVKIDTNLLGTVWSSMGNGTWNDIPYNIRAYNTTGKMPVMPELSMYVDRT